MLVAAHLAGVAGRRTVMMREASPSGNANTGIREPPGTTWQRHAVPVDKSRRQVHTPWVGALPKRLNIPDARVLEHIFG